jgi:hypothetical protein
MHKPDCQESVEEGVCEALELVDSDPYANWDSIPKTVWDICWDNGLIRGSALVGGGYLTDKGRMFLHYNKQELEQLVEPVTERVLQLVSDERLRQNAKWGDQHHDPGTWLLILQEEIGELAAATLQGRHDDALDELVQMTAVTLAWLADLTRPG